MFFQIYLHCSVFFRSIRDWSLITGRGGLQNGRGGHVKFYPYKTGAEKVLAMLKGGHNKFWGSFYAVA